MALRKRGFVLRTVDFAESDLIFDFLDSDGSVFTFHAKGGRASKRRFSGGVLDPLQYIEISFEQKKEDKPFLLEAKIINAFDGIRADYDRILWGTRLLSLTGFYAQEGLPEPEQFHLLGNAMKKLEELSSTPAHVFWHFLARSMALHGDLERTQSLSALLGSPIGAIEMDRSMVKVLEKDLRRQFIGIFSKPLSDLIGYT